jgi:hypothetical protein
MNELTFLFDLWRKIPEKICQDQCDYTHWVKKQVISSENGIRFANNIPVDKPDMMVCSRERAWRKYVKKRDEILGGTSGDKRID